MISVEEYRKFLRSSTLEERLARLRRIGLFDENNKVTPKYSDWGCDYVSKTAVFESADPE